MKDRYDTSGNPEAQYAPGSNAAVLANKLGISDKAEMDDTELSLLEQLYHAVISTTTEDQPIRVATIREWHRSWLGNVYVWAGQDRTVNIGKGGFQFAAAGQIPKLLDELERQFLAVHTPCVEMTEARLVEAIASVHIELILIHPFREGNGRLSRLLANVMALQAGWPELDFAVWDQDKPAYFAAIRAGLGGDQPMQQLVRRVLRESVSRASE